MTTQGYARYNNAEGTGTPGAYWSAYIIEYDAIIQNVSRWRMLNTMTSETAYNLRSWGKFSNISVGGSTPTTSMIELGEEYATITPSYTNGLINTLEINVSK